MNASRRQRPRPLTHEREAALAWLCEEALREARELLGPLASAADFLPVLEGRGALQHQVETAGFCSRFAFHFLHLSPELLTDTARLLVFAVPAVTELHRRLELWAPEEEGGLPSWVCEQARACLAALALPGPGVDGPESSRVLH